MRASPPATHPAAAPSREWLLVNGLGCSASGTASGARARAWHAALSVPAEAGEPRPALLALDARAVVEGRTYELDAHEGDPRERPASRARITSFSAQPMPEWRYQAGPTRIGRRLFLLHDQHALVVAFGHIEGPPARIDVAPVFTAGARDPESGAPAAPLTQSIPGRLRVTTGDGSLTVWHDGAFLPARAWQPRAEGGPDAAMARKDVGALAGFIEATLGPGACLHIVVAVDETLLRRLAEEGRLGTPPPRTLRGCVEMIEAGERARGAAERGRALFAAGRTAREAHVARHADAAPRPDSLVAPDDPWVPRLARALDWDARLPGERLAGSAATRALRTVRGLLTLGEVESVRETLLAYGQLMRDGLVPSSLDPGATSRYDDPAASLWLVIAAELFARRTGEYEFVRRALYPALEQVIERYRGGAGLGLRLGEHGLLVGGEGEAAAARAELNALWYTAQAAMGQLARALGHKQNGAFYIAWAREHQTRAIELLWDEPAGVLYTMLAPAGAVRGLEPSLVLAASLSPPLLVPERAQRLLGAIARELLTPGGLREAPGSRRIATEWMGAFLSAWVRAHGRSGEAQERARDWADRFAAAIEHHAAGCVPETFESVPKADDGEEGLHYTGRPLSVLATAEMTRFWVEDLDPEWRVGHPATP